MESNHKFPTFEEHRDSWKELACGIASLKKQVREDGPVDVGRYPPPGELIIIGSGIETVGFTLGDRQLIELGLDAGDASPLIAQRFSLVQLNLKSGPGEIVTPAPGI